MVHTQRSESPGRVAPGTSPGSGRARAPQRWARAGGWATRVAVMGALVAASGACGPRRVYVPGQPERVELTRDDLVLAYSHKANRQAGDFMEQVLVRGTLGGGGGAEGDADLRVRVTTPGGDKYAVTVKRKRGRWTWAPDRLGATLGESTIEASPRGLMLHLTDGVTTIDVDIANEVQPLRPAGGTARFGGAGYYQTTVLAPRGELKVTVERPAPVEASATPEAEPTEPVAPERESTSWSGFAYAEHRVSTVLPHEAAQTWVNAYRVDEERTFILSVFQTPPARGGEVHGWLFYADEDGALVYRPTLTVETAEATVHRRSGYAVPAVVKFHGAGGLVGALQATRSLGAKDELAGMSAMERFIVSKMTKPWSFPHEARYLLVVPEVDELGNPLPGEDGEPGPAARYTGDTRYVFMRLN